MQRDDDLLRKLLFEAEEYDRGHLSSFEFEVSDEDYHRLDHHLLLLLDAGLMDVHPQHGGYRLTSAGHDFLEAVRNDTVWNKTKKIAYDGGAASLGVFFDVAVGLAKQKITEKTGISL